jgi:hypothetical protein
MSKQGKTRDEPAMSLWLVVPIIGLLGIALAGGLKLFKIVGQLDRLVSSLLADIGLADPGLSLDSPVIWSGSAVLALVLAAAILNVAGWWRRWFIWVMMLVLTVSWAPVLLLASHKPEIGMAVIAVLWSGCCAMFYAFSHEMPADVAERDELK